MRLGELCNLRQVSEELNTDSTTHGSIGVDTHTLEKRLRNSKTLEHGRQEFGDLIVVHPYGHEINYVDFCIQEAVDPALDADQLAKTVLSLEFTTKVAKKFLNLLAVIYAMRGSPYVAAEIFDRLYSINRTQFDKSQDDNREIFANFLARVIPFRQGVTVFQSLAKFYSDTSELTLPMLEDGKRWEDVRKDDIKFNNITYPNNDLVTDMEAVHTPLDAVLQSDNKDRGWGLFSRKNSFINEQAEQLQAVRNTLLNNPLVMAIYDRLNSLALRVSKRIYTRRESGVVPWQVYLKETLDWFGEIYYECQARPQFESIVQLVGNAEQKRAEGLGKNSEGIQDMKRERLNELRLVFSKQLHQLITNPKLRGHESAYLGTVDQMYQKMGDGLDIIEDITGMLSNIAEDEGHYALSGRAVHQKAKIMLRNLESEVTPSMHEGVYANLLQIFRLHHWAQHCYYKSWEQTMDRQQEERDKGMLWVNFEICEDIGNLLTKYYGEFKVIASDPSKYGVTDPKELGMLIDPIDAYNKAMRVLQEIESTSNDLELENSQKLITEYKSRIQDRISKARKLKGL